MSAITALAPLVPFRAQLRMLNGYLKRFAEDQVASVSTTEVATARTRATEALAGLMLRYFYPTCCYVVGPLLGPSLGLWFATFGLLLFSGGSYPYIDYMVGGTLVTGGLFALLVRCEDTFAAAQRVLAVTKPLSELHGEACALALAAVESCPAAGRIRDLVVARGEELLEFHLTAMVSLHSAEVRARNPAQRRAACQALHGIAHADPTKQLTPAL